LVPTQNGFFFNNEFFFGCKMMSYFTCIPNDNDNDNVIKFII